MGRLGERLSEEHDRETLEDHDPEATLSGQLKKSCVQHFDSHKGTLSPFRS